MKTISVSPNLHRYIMDHKDADHKSAEAVIYGLIGENDEMKKEIKRLINENVELMTQNKKVIYVGNNKT